MQLREIFKASGQALKGNLLRTALTMLGIVIGIASVILIISIGEGATASITNELSSFGTNFFSINPGSVRDGSAFTGTVDTLTQDDADAIEKEISNVKTVSSASMSTFVVTANGEDDRLLVQGVNHEVFTIINPDLLTGRFLEAEDEIGLSRVAVIGKDAAEEFFGVGADPVDEVIRIDGRPFRVVGMIESTSRIAGGFVNDAVFIPVDVILNQLLGVDYLQEIQVAVNDTDRINQTIADVEDLLRERHDIEADEESDFSIQSFKDALDTLETVTGLLTTMVAAISGISLVVGGIGIMNIMLVTVTERTKEIGLLKAIGAKQGDILIQFLVEAITMTVVGGLVGILIGISGAFIIARVVDIPFVISPMSIVIAVGVSSLVGVVFGLYPARRAAKLNPIDALRYEWPHQ